MAKNDTKRQGSITKYHGPALSLRNYVANPPPWGLGGLLFFLPNIIEVTRAGVSAYFNQVKNVLRGASEHTRK